MLKIGGLWHFQVQNEHFSIFLQICVFDFSETVPEESESFFGPKSFFTLLKLCSLNFSENVSNDRYQKVIFSELFRIFTKILLRPKWGN